MASRLLDMSLDDIIKERNDTKKGRGGAGGRGPSTRSGQRNFRNIRNSSFNKRTEEKGDPESQWEHDLFVEEDGERANGGNKPRISITTGGRVAVSGLHFEILSDDLKDIFEQVGEVLSAEVHFDESDRSAGTGEVVFHKKS